LEVPDILLSGNAKEIEKWQMEQSIERTKKLRAGFVQETLEICVLEISILLHRSYGGQYTKIYTNTNIQINQFKMTKK
jgi:hypothetical protein